MRASPLAICLALRTRAQIRRQAKGRKSVEEGKPDRLAKQLEDAADVIEELFFTLDEIQGRYAMRVGYLGSPVLDDARNLLHRLETQ